MNSILLEINDIRKSFGRKILFEKISFSIKNAEAYAITGKNGSGKSTLVKILCGLLSPSGGTIRYTIDNREIPLSELYPVIGLVSPYLNMYEEFTGEENLMLFMKIRGMAVDAASIESLLHRFNIYQHRKKEVRYYSSGMKQRLKYCAALIHKPILLYLDEPTANLDDLGIAVVREVMMEQKKSAALIFATNESEDLQYADKTLDLR